MIFCLYRNGKWWDVSETDELAEIRAKVGGVLKLMQAFDTDWRGVIFKLSGLWWCMLNENHPSHKIVLLGCESLLLGRNEGDADCPGLPTEVWELPGSPQERGAVAA